MFKKPVQNWKTSSPLRSSDRKKLKQKIVESFGISSEEAEQLVPDGILSVKFSTHLGEPGIAYLSPATNDPLWFSLGKGSDLEGLIPTVCTLWSHPRLLPFLSTPKAVIPILTGGADLMIPGVIHCPSSLVQGQLVSICKYEPSAISPPLAVGRMAVDSESIANAKEKGKAVLVLHAWKDHLWDMGSSTKREIPPSVPFNTEEEEEEQIDTEAEAETTGTTTIKEQPQPQTEEPSTSSPLALSYTADETTQLLRISLIHTIAKGSTITFPIPATTFYTSYILPNRPYFPDRALTSSAASASASDSSQLPPPPDPYSITIKSSSHKSLSSFLKSAEKTSLLTTKGKGDLLITSLNASHPDVQAQQTYVTILDVESKAAKKAAREEKANEERKAADRELEVRELWKPHQASLALFEAMGASTSSALYTLPEIRTLLNTYITSHQLINSHDQAYINVGTDEVLSACVSTKANAKKGGDNKSKGKPKPKSGSGEETDAEMEFMKRDEVMRRVLNKMQGWYEVRKHEAGQNSSPKKGKLSPIQIATKLRQGGRKASTLITGFEPFYVDAEEMAEDLRRVCSGSTSVSQISGKPLSSSPGSEVLVQGKQSKAVVDYLMGKGVPKKWIEIVGG